MITVQQIKQEQVEVFAVMYNNKIIATFMSKNYAEMKAAMYKKYLERVQNEWAKKDQKNDQI